MDFSIKTGHPEKQRSHCIIVGVFEPRRLSASAQKLDEASDGYISQLLRKGDCEGKLGQTLLVHQIPGLHSDRVLFVGLGKENALKESQFRDCVMRAIALLQDTGAQDVLFCLGDFNVPEKDLSWKIRQTIQILNALMYQSDTFKSQKNPPRRSLQNITFLAGVRKEAAKAERAIDEGKAISNGMNFTKELANLPPNICTPVYLAKRAKAFAKENPKISTAILEEKEMEALGMGSLLSVTAGSNNPAKLITMEYRGAKKDVKPIVLVGKGITFDTGGNSLKAPMKMIGMKYDMCGGATVFGVLQAAVDLALPLNIIGIIPTCENMPGPSATRPEDVVTSLSGTTIEILNTDAEGRLILADALTYAERFNPDVVIDVATLTGACLFALGIHTSALMSNNDALAQSLLEAGQKAGDRAWQLPIWDEYHETLKSEVADVTNISTADVGAGTIIAACFLSKFTQKYPWAHLDIAYTAVSNYGPKRGATGRPVPLLVQYLIDRC